MTSSEPAMHSSRPSFWNLLSSTFTTYKDIFLPLTAFMLLYAMIDALGTTLTVYPTFWPNDTIRSLVKLGSLLLGLYFYIVALVITIQAVKAKPLDTRSALMQAGKNFFRYIGMTFLTVWYAVKWTIPFWLPMAFLGFFLLESNNVPNTLILQETFGLVRWLFGIAMMSIPGAILVLVSAGLFIHIFIRSIRAIFSEYVFIQDKKGMSESVRVSVEMTKGQWWRTAFYTIGMLILTETLIKGLLDTVLGFIVGQQQTAREIGQVIISTLAASILMIFIAHLYNTMKIIRKQQ